MQAKRWMRTFILRRSRVGRKIGSSSGFQGLLAESLRCQVAGSLRPRPSAFHETPCPLRLWLQAFQRLLDHLVGDPLSPEVVPDGRIAVASFDEAVGPGTREAGVVDEPGAERTASDSSTAAGATEARASRSAMPRCERSRRRSARPATASASARRSSWRRRRSAARSSARPSMSPERTTTSTGSVRHGASSNSTATRPRRSPPAPCGRACSGARRPRPAPDCSGSRAVPSTFAPRRADDFARRARADASGSTRPSSTRRARPATASVPATCCAPQTI